MPAFGNRDDHLVMTVPGFLAGWVDPRLGLVRDGEHGVVIARRCLPLGRRPGQGAAPFPGAPGMDPVARLLPRRPDAGLDRLPSR